MPEEEKIQWGIQGFSKELKDQFKFLAYKNGMTIKDALRYVICKWIREEKKTD